MYVRMALILTLLGLAPSGPLAEQALSAQRAAEATGAPCRNPAVSRLPKKSLCPCTSPTLTVCRAVCTASTKCRDLSPLRAAA